MKTIATQPIDTGHSRVRGKHRSRRHAGTASGRAWLLACLACATAQAGIPTAAERMESSTLSSDYEPAWRAGYLLPDARRLPEDAEDSQACFRKDFELTAAPREAAVTLKIHGTPYWFAVNGNTLLAPRPNRIQYGAIGWGTGGLVHVDLTPHLRAGRNVLTFRMPYGDGTPGGRTRLTVEGIVFCEDGSTVRILTDGWRGGWDLAGGWDDPDTDPGLLPELPERGAPLRTGPYGRDTPDLVLPRPYYGPIQVRPVAELPKELPIFDEGDTVALAVRLMNLQGHAPPPELEVAVMDQSKRADLGRRVLALEPHGALDLAAELDVGRLSRGTYRLRFILRAAAEELDRRDVEVAVVGPIPQREVAGAFYEDGLDLREVWSVDCTIDPPGEQDFVAAHTVWEQTPEAGVPTEVAESPAGRYRALTNNRGHHYFAYRYRLDRLFTPHLAVVEWPDDVAREFIVHVVEQASGFPDQAIYRQYYGAVEGFQRAEAAVVTRHDEQPERSGRMQRLHLLFWPNAADGSLHVTNVGGGAPGAAARMTIYEITNDLPALRVADAGERTIGYLTERGPYTLAGQYYAGPLGSYFMSRLGPKDHPEYYRNWLTTVENLVKRMRFSGQNAYFMGKVMYTGTLFPSRLGLFGQNAYHGGEAVRSDYVDLILRVFAHHDLALYSNINLMSLPTLVQAQPGEEEIRAGTASPLFSVSRDGKLFPLHATRRGPDSYGGSGGVPDRRTGLFRWPALNYFHPEIQEAVIEMVGELADLYGEYPAWRGVTLMLSRAMGIMDPAFLRSADLLQGGYEDYTIERFERDTGLRVPGDPAAPDRFERRYQWLTTQAREAWIDWRCARYAELFERMAARVSAGRDDVYLHLILGEPMISGPGSPEMLDGYENRLGERGLEILRSFGLDLERLRAVPGLRVAQTFAVAGSGEALGAAGHPAWRMLNRSHDWQALFADDGRGGAFLKGNIPHYGGYTYPENHWLFTRNRTRQGYFWSTHVVESFVQVMVRSNPAWMPHTWMDVSESMGRIQELRTFARAYRSLPNMRYERIAAMSDDTLWLARGTPERPDGGDYAYAANLHWEPREVTLRFSRGSRVRDLVRGTPVDLDGQTWTFTLAPYGIQTLRVADGRVLIPGS